MKFIKRIRDFFFRYKFIGSKGIHSYYENRWTGERMSFSDYDSLFVGENEQNLDFDWLNKKRDNLF